MPYNAKNFTYVLFLGKQNEFAKKNILVVFVIYIGSSLEKSSTKVYYVMLILRIRAPTIMGALRISVYSQ